MFREEVLSYLGGCFNGEPASCSFACPFRPDMRAFLKKASKGRWDAAYKELRTYIPFPEVTAALCPGMCEGACQHRTVLGGESIAVRELERACIALARRKEGASYAIPPREERVAIIGAGAAGLACALGMAQKKYKVTVFDRAEGWGGCLRHHPDFAVFDADFKMQFAPVEAEFRFGEEIKSLDELADFSAVFIAAGRGGDTFGLMDSWDGKLYSTSRPGVFLGGEAAGLTLIEGMASGLLACRPIEAYLQTGRPENAADNWGPSHACRFIPHEGAPSESVKPAGERYTADEARAEAARCMQCDCTVCMDACELLGKYNKKPPRIASDVIQDGQSRNSVSTASITRETWSCNLCHRCERDCSAGTNVAGIFQASRASRVTTGYYPPALHAYWLREMAQASDEAALTIAGTGTDVFFPGCRLGASNPEYVLRSYDILREKLGAGLILDCCGAPAYWAGETAALDKHISALREKWEGLGCPRLIVGCPSCIRVLKTLLPEIETVSLYTVLAELGIKSTASAPVFGTAAVFDPCAGSGDLMAKAAVRALAESTGVSLTDFDSDGRCCGFGGHMQLADPALYREMTGSRASLAEEPYIVWCSNCLDVFRSAGKRCAHVLDLLFGLESSPTSLEEKRKNRLALKKELLSRQGDDSFMPEAREWDTLPVSYTPDIIYKMELELIPMGDVLETIWRAERDGSGFENDAGERLVRHTFGPVVVWAQYRRGEDGCFELLDVYSHRMQVRKEGTV
jgi:Fe-S oxidoreductase